MAQENLRKVLEEGNLEPEDIDNIIKLLSTKEKQDRFFEEIKEFPKIGKSQIYTLYAIAWKIDNDVKVKLENSVKKR